MRVEKVVCDRCGAEWPAENAEPGLLSLKARYRSGERPGWLPERRTLELCGVCRESFARWFGEHGREVPDLQPPARGAPVAMETPGAAPGS